MITTVAFDADDTLWHNERIFIDAREKLKRILSRYKAAEWVENILDETESRNIAHYGFGVKAFTLSMIETACELSDNKVTGSEVAEIIGLAKEMIASPINLLPKVEQTIHQLSHEFRLVLITKGDLFDQETKLARSGLGDLFDIVEVVAKKDPETYRRILSKHNIKPNEFVMIGNSMRSDIMPVVETGGKAIHIAYETEWILDAITEEEKQRLDFVSLESICQVPDWIKNENADKTSVATGTFATV
jgi:putative hydrolase of the HAD superfamily